MQYANLSRLLVVSYALSLPGAGMITAAHAAQDVTGTAPESAQHESDAKQLYGRITAIIAAESIGYVEIDTGNRRVWSAGPVEHSLAVGDGITISTSMPMRNFHSKTLDRDFPLVYFVKQFNTDSGPAGTPASGGREDPQGASFAAKPITRAETEIGPGGYLGESMLDGLNTDGKALSDYKGKPLIINVWASWCGPCRLEMGSLERLAQQYNGKLFNIIGISTDDYRDKAATFIEDTKITFDNYIDHNLTMERMLGANTIPLTVLVDSNGRVLTKVRGSREWDSPEIVQAIEKAFQINTK
jgi:thiol-disulfide isomerase/thioredoxin